MSNYSVNDVVEYFYSLQHIMNDRWLKEDLFENYDDSSCWRVKDIFDTFKILNLSLIESTDEYIIFEYDTVKSRDHLGTLWIDFRNPELIEFYTSLECNCLGKGAMFENVDDIRQKVYQWQQGEEKESNSGNFFTDIFLSNNAYNKNEKPFLRVDFVEEEDESVEDYLYKGKFFIRYFCAKPDSLESLAFYTRAFIKDMTNLVYKTDLHSFIGAEQRSKLKAKEERMAAFEELVKKYGVEEALKRVES